MKLLEKQAGVARDKLKAAGNKRKRGGAFEQAGGEKKGKGTKAKRAARDDEDCSEVCRVYVCTSIPLQHERQ